jgi:hypothetical protein
LVNVFHDRPSAPIVDVFGFIGPKGGVGTGVNGGNAGPYIGYAG